MKNKPYLTIFVFTIFLLQLTWLSPLKAQNMVPNPSFEDTTSCPTMPDQISNAVGWTSRYSADYFNTCATNPNISVPTNWGGYQQPATGNAYCAFVTGLPKVREFIRGPLSSTMTIGTTYYVSFKLSLSISTTINSTSACNKMGVTFSTSPINQLTNVGHVYSSSVITDTVGWTTVTGSFVADSNYTYMNIGNFFEDNLITYQNFTTTPSVAAYYYIDDICVSTDSLTCTNNEFPNAIIEKDLASSIQIYPNPSTTELNIQSKIPISAYSIYDLSGRLIQSEKAANSSVNLTNLVEGVYILKLISGDRVIHKRFVKQ